MIRRLFQLAGLIILCFSVWTIYQNHCTCTQDIGLLPGIVLGAALLAIPENYSLDLMRIVFWGVFLASLFAITEVNSEWKQVGAFIIAMFSVSKLGLPISDSDSDDFSRNDSFGSSSSDCTPSCDSDDK